MARDSQQTVPLLPRQTASRFQACKCSTLSTLSTVQCSIITISTETVVAASAGTSASVTGLTFPCPSNKLHSGGCDSYQAYSTAPSSTLKTSLQSLDAKRATAALPTQAAQAPMVAEHRRTRGQNNAHMVFPRPVLVMMDLTCANICKRLVLIITLAAAGQRVWYSMTLVGKVHIWL
jgi:hypothetical protein